MYWSTEITQENPDKLSKRVWRFSVFDLPNIHLDAVMDMSRQSTRHKYKVNGIWTRLNRRHNNMERIDPPSILKEEVLQVLVSELRFD